MLKGLLPFIPLPWKDATLPPGFIETKEHITHKCHTVNFKMMKILVLQKVVEILKRDTRKSHHKRFDKVGMNHTNMLKWRKHEDKLVASNK